MGANRTGAILGLLLVMMAVAAYASGFDGLNQLPPHTAVFVGAALLVTVYFGHIRFDRFAVAHGPEILTTIGIFGCFYGVSLGLLHFNTGDIATSVPKLLEGIRTAFWASLTGIGGALYIKARHAFTKMPIPQSSELPKAGTLDDLIGVALRVQKGVVGEDEGTLLSQLKLMRQDQRDGLHALIESFNGFAEKMAEDNSKALIEALKEVIRDFNAKINEQFGDNFKQLNAAVEKLVTWQQQYKEELDAIKSAQEQTAQDMRAAAAAFSVIVQRSSEFEKVAQRLEEMLRALAADLARNAEAERALHQALSDMRQVTPLFAEKTAAMLEDIRSGATRVQGEFEAMGRNIATTSQNAQSELKRILAESITETHKQVSSHVQTLSKETRDQVVALDTALSKELTKAIETLGQQLAALSRKFVEDYAPLTDRLRALVQLGRAG